MAHVRGAHSRLRVRALPMRPSRAHQLIRQQPVSGVMASTDIDRWAFMWSSGSVCTHVTCTPASHHSTAGPMSTAGESWHQTQSRTVRPLRRCARSSWHMGAQQISGHAFITRSYYFSRVLVTIACRWYDVQSRIRYRQHSGSGQPSAATAVPCCTAISSRSRVYCFKRIPSSHRLHRGHHSVELKLMRRVSHFVHQGLSRHESNPPPVPAWATYKVVTRWVMRNRSRRRLQAL